MPRLPDVQSLGARQTPGAPRQLSLESPEATQNAVQGQVLADVGGQMQAVAQRIFARQDAINHAKALNEINQLSVSELTRLNSEADLSDAQTLQGYQSFLGSKQKELVDRYGGSADSRAALQRDLERAKGRYLGHAAEMSTQIAMDNLDRAMTGQLSELSGLAGSDPTAVSGALNEWQRRIDTYRGALPPGAEQSSLYAGWERISQAAIGSALATGDYEGAMDMTAALAPYMTPETQNEVRMNIAAQRAEQNKIVNEVATMTQLLGRSPSSDELLERFGYAPSTPQVVVNNAGSGGAPMPEIGTIPQGFQAVWNPSTGSFEMSRVPGGPAEAESQAVATATAGQTASAGERTEIMTRDIGRIFDVLEANPATSSGPIAGRVGGVIPGSPSDRINILLDPIRANVGFSQLQAMRDSSPTGGALGQVTERELAFLQSTLGNLDTRLPEEQLARNLVDVAASFARVAYGSDDELDLAVEQGRLTQGQASAAIQAREEIVGGMEQRAQSFLAKKEEPSRPAQSSQRQQSQAAPEQFRDVVRAMRQNPESLSPEKIAGMGFSQEQLRALADLYDSLTEESGDGG